MKKKHAVIIIESERGWGQRVDETRLFDTKQEAEAFCHKFNSSNTEPTAPDWYMRADYAGLAEADEKAPEEKKTPKDAPKISNLDF